MKTRLQLLAFFNAAFLDLRATGAAKSSLILSLVAVGVLLFAPVAVEAQATNTFPSSGNVGIGTTSPSALLQVYSNSSSGGYGHEVIESDVNAQFVPTLEMIDNRTGASGHDYQLINGGLGSALAIKDLTENTFDMVISGSRQVGIGTISPSYTLDVNSGSEKNVMQVSSSGTDTILFLTNTTADGQS